MSFLVYLLVLLTNFGAVAQVSVFNSSVLGIAQEDNVLPVSSCETLVTEDYPLSPTPEEAEKILGSYRPFDIGTGEGGPGKQIEIAVNYVLKNKQRGIKQVEHNLTTFLKIIRVMAMRDATQSNWRFTKFKGHDGSIVFLGSVGHALILRPYGAVVELYKAEDLTIVDMQAWPTPEAYKRLKKLGDVHICCSSSGH